MNKKKLLVALSLCSLLGTQSVFAADSEPAAIESGSGSSTPTATGETQEILSNSDYGSLFDDQEARSLVEDGQPTSRYKPRWRPGYLVTNRAQLIKNDLINASTQDAWLKKRTSEEKTNLLLDADLKDEEVSRIAAFVAVRILDEMPDEISNNSELGDTVEQTLKTRNNAINDLIESLQEEKKRNGGALVEIRNLKTAARDDSMSRSLK